MLTMKTDERMIASSGRAAAASSHGMIAARMIWAIVAFAMPSLRASGAAAAPSARRQNLIEDEPRTTSCLPSASENFVLREFAPEKRER